MEATCVRTSNTGRTPRSNVTRNVTKVRYCFQVALSITFLLLYMPKQTQPKPKNTRWRWYCPDLCKSWGFKTRPLFFLFCFFFKIRIFFFHRHRWTGSRTSKSRNVDVRQRSTSCERSYVSLLFIFACFSPFTPKLKKYVLTGDEVVRIGSIIIFHLRKLSKAKFFIQNKKRRMTKSRRVELSRSRIGELFRSRRIENHRECYFRWDISRSFTICHKAYFSRVRFETNEP